MGSKRHLWRLERRAGSFASLRVELGLPGCVWPDSPVPILQGPCNLSQKWRGTLRFLPDLEIRPSSIAANPVESQEASPSSIVSLTSQRHPEKLPEVTGTSRGNPGFPAATRERPRASFFIALSPDSTTMTREQ